jgi:rSAM/selenodomain-associated transferase 1
MKPTLVVFAKAPRMGFVKRRLARDLGWVAATAFCRRTTAEVLRRLGSDPRWRCLLAVTPDRDSQARFWPGRFGRLKQGPGDLGARMERPMRRLPKGPVVIVGTDIPDLDRRHVAAAFKGLGSHDAVLGPAGDGGYWLVGLRRRPMVPPLFRRVRWSSEHALADTLAGLPEGFRVSFLETLEDVDDGASWSRHYSGRV